MEIIHVKDKGFFIEKSSDEKKEIIKVDKYSFKNEKINVFKYEK